MKKYYVNLNLKRYHLLNVFIIFIINNFYKDYFLIVYTLKMNEINSMPNLRKRDKISNGRSSSLLTLIPSSKEKLNRIPKKTLRNLQNIQKIRELERHNHTLSLPQIASVPSMRSLGSKGKSKIYNERSAKDIYQYYLDKDDNEVNLDEKNIEKILKHKKLPKNKLKLYDLYNINQNFVKKIRDLKNNREIAYKKDFKVEEYQDTLIKLLDGKISNQNLSKLNQNFISLNERNNSEGSYRKNIHKGKWQILAQRIEHFAPKYLVDKFNSLGEKRKKKEIKENSKKLEVIN